MSDINASLGYSQLNKLDGFVKKEIYLQACTLTNFLKFLIK